MFTKPTYTLLNMSTVGSQAKRGYTGLCLPCSWLAPSIADWWHQDLIGFSFESPGFILCFCCIRQNWMRNRETGCCFQFSVWNNSRTVLQPSRVVFWKHKDVNVLHNQHIACRVCDSIWRCKAFWGSTEGQNLGQSLSYCLLGMGHSRDLTTADN